MFRTLRWRLTFWYGGMAAVVLLLLFGALYLQVRTLLIVERRAEVLDAAAAAARILDDTGSPGLAVKGAREPGILLQVRDSYGNVLAATPGIQRIPALGGPVVHSPGVERKGDYLATSFQSRKLPGATMEVYGTLRKVDVVLRGLLIAEAVSLAAGLVVMMGFGPALAASALRPLKRVSALAGELRRGDLSQRVNLPELSKRRDEVGDVAASFDSMAESLEHLFQLERDSNESMRRFLADASHEMRTPLTSIIGYLDVLAEGGSTDPEAGRRAMRAVREETGRMARLVEDLLTLARLDTRREIPAEIIELSALTREVVEEYKNYKGREIEITTSDAVTVLAPRDSLRRVISNLLSNAVKYTPPEEKIQVTVGCEGGEAVLRVADRGVGIPEADLPHVFDRFYQVESSRVGEGSGLGLAIVRDTARALGGRVGVESAIGMGSTFTVHLPTNKN